MNDAIIIIPTLNEEKYLSRTLESLKNQTVHCETLIVDSNSIDRTLDIAKSFEASVISAGRGKLTARDVAIRAVKSDVIISCDADCFYPPRWVENTLAAFKDGVVGVTGPRYYDTRQEFRDLQSAFYDKCWRLFGSNSAFLRNCYLMSGGFDLSINQQDSKAMVDEEEVLFRNRLAAFGDVIYQPENPIITSTRRFGFFGKGDKEFLRSKAAGERF